MRAINFVGANVMMGAPEGWDEKRDGACFTLPVFRSHGVCTSMWKPTLEELAQLAAGGAIALQIEGPQPLVMLRVVEVQELPANNPASVVQ